MISHSALNPDSSEALIAAEASQALLAWSADEVLCSLPDAVAIVQAGQVIFINPAFTRLFGYSAEEAREQIPRLFVPESRRDENNRVERAVDRDGSAAVETVRLARGGAPVDVALFAAPLTVRGVGAGYVLSFRDIGAHKRVEASLQHHAMHDPLTGLPNRALFLDRLSHALSHRVRRRDRFCAVLFLDLDGFKQVNDTLGHAVGDELLKAVARRLGTVLRPQDTAARMGGDEFAVLLETILSIPDLETVTSRIAREMDQPYEVDSRPLHCAVSVGAAMAGAEYLAPELLIRDADFAMYRAKQQGGGRFEIFDKQLKIEAASMEERERELRSLLDKRSFEFWYEPILRLKGGKLEGLQAQLRWRREDGSVDDFAELLPVAEETGLSITLGRETIEQVCRQLRQWSDALPSLEMTLTIRLSSRQFYHSDLVSQMKRSLAATGADPDRLLLELPESTLNENPTYAESTLQRLADCSLRLAVTDFGSSLAPLNALLRLPIDVVKLDSSLTATSPYPGRPRAVLDSLIHLGRKLGIQMIAQGIETSEQLDALRRMGCELGQGPLLSAALDPAQALKLAESQG